MKSREYAKYKVSQMDGILHLTDAQMQELLKKVELEPSDIHDLLMGHNIQLLDMSDILECPTDVFFAGLKIFAETVKQSGLDPDLAAWQRNSGLDFEGNPVARLVGGDAIDFRKVRTMDENTVKHWICTYLQAIRAEKYR